MLKTTTAVINASQITGVLPVVNGGTGVTTSTGTGSTVLSTSPTFATPILGVASATSVNKIAITAPATGATLTIVEGKTLTANHSLTLAGTDATTMTFPTTSATVARTDAANSFTGDQTLSTGNLIVSNGKGIDFSATPGTGTSELLADYEEGTWTPALSAFSLGNLTATYALRNGQYTRIGNLVTITALIATSSFTHTTAAGPIAVTGIPFTGTAAILQPRGAVHYSGYTKANYPQMTATVTQGQIVVNFGSAGSGQTSVETNITDFPTGGTVNLNFTVSYFV